jgi:hypothetical protein
MKSLQQILAENMLRFGTKNLGKKKLFEQTIKLYGKAKTYQEAKKYLKNSVAIIRTHKDKIVDVPVPKISAQFYNNMVTLENGLMPSSTKEIISAAIDKDLIATIQNIPDIDLNNLKLIVTGTASSAKPSMSPDTRMSAGTKLDHPGTPYDGLDISKPENYLAGNQYLAKKRAEAISALIKERFTAAGLTVPTITTTAKVLEGNADELRYLEVQAAANSKTDDIVETWQTFLNFGASLQYKDAKTPAQAVSDIEDTLAGGDEDYAGIQSYRASISIEYGAPQGSYVPWTGTYNALDDAHATAPGYRGMSDSSARYAGGWVQGSTDLAVSVMNSGGSNPLTGTIPSLGDFLKACGHFTAERAKEIENNMNDVGTADFKALAEKGSGNLSDFVTALGGNATPSLAVGAAIYDTKTQEIFRVVQD